MFINVQQEGGCRRQPPEGRQPYHPALAQVVAKRRLVDAGLYDMPENAVRYTARANEARTVRKQRTFRRNALHFVHALLLERTPPREG